MSLCKKFSKIKSMSGYIFKAGAMNENQKENPLFKFEIDQFRYIKIQPQTIDLSTRLWGINTEFVGFIPHSLVLRSIVD